MRQSSKSKFTRSRLWRDWPAAYSETRTNASPRIDCGIRETRLWIRPNCFSPNLWFVYWPQPLPSRQPTQRLVYRLLTPLLMFRQRPASSQVKCLPHSAMQNQTSVWVEHGVAIPVLKSIVESSPGPTVLIADSAQSKSNRIASSRSIDGDLG